MSTKQQTQGSNSSQLQFNPIAQQMYNQLVSGGGNVLKGYINDPFGNAFYNLGAGQSQRGAQQAGANNMAALRQLMRTSGFGGQAGAGFSAAQQARTGRANSAMSSQANTSNVLAALQRQMMAAGTGLSFSPQLTGQTGNFSQTSQTSGLGTWLPQLMSGAISAGMGAMTGGASMAMNPAMGFKSGGAPTAVPGMTGMTGTMAPMPDLGNSNAAFNPILFSPMFAGIQ